MKNPFICIIIYVNIKNYYKGYLNNSQVCIQYLKSNEDELIPNSTSDEYHIYLKKEFDKEVNLFQSIECNYIVNFIGYCQIPKQITSIVGACIRCWNVHLLHEQEI